MLDTLVEFAGVKALEIGALAALDVDNLDVITRLDEIAFRRGRFHPQVKHRIGQWVGQVELAHLARTRAVQVKRQGRGGVLRIRCHRQAGGGKDQPAVIECGELGAGAGGGVGGKEPHRTGARQINALARNAAPQAGQPLTRRIAQGQHGLQPLGPGIRGLPQNRGVNPALGRSGDQFGDLPALIIDHCQPVTRAKA